MEREFSIKSEIVKYKIIKHNPYQTINNRDGKGTAIFKPGVKPNQIH